MVGKPGRFAAYWANTSSNSLIGKLVRQGSPDIKMDMEGLLRGEVLHTRVDEQIVFSQLGQSEVSVWSLLLAGGYLKVESRGTEGGADSGEYVLSLTNREVHIAFERMVQGWFEPCAGCYNRFIRALLSGNLDDMNGYMNDLAAELFSSFDGGRKPSEKARPERFYHGFVLGLLVELKDRYGISSNGESGYGRYDIILEPKKDDLDTFLIEFKVADARHGETLEACVESALKQIEEMRYETVLWKKGIPAERIHRYGFAFEGKTVLIG
ncbi:PD-(D/E)XK nuclease domain-containing protein [uncultured Acetatifactor sp.]|uniref:PD-(D/E)XK nuclease domain-containing protein n=1 Tax=uncultured Acetatifactor sp. TaxID=1671927 RepID=UPI002608164C|nr:PD-(D/E)XK nuclease domain-containing protein [uncultured Acetatifactor sp.]